MPDSQSILITGGAGFIGCELSATLVDSGHRVTVMDVLHPQVHKEPGLPARLHPDVQFLPVDVTSGPSWAATLHTLTPDCVVHLAAETGTGQSLTEGSRHATVNVVGTTRMTDALGRAGVTPAHVVLASSRAVYGEGLWESDGQVFSPGVRSHADLEAGRWEPVGGGAGTAVPLASRAATTPTAPTSIYGATKLAQEHILGAWTSAMGASLSVLRLQNVFGPGQAVGNPYTGIVTLFARQALANEVIDIYEDGEIVRDFVYIDDVVSALAAAIEQPPEHQRSVDIGSGRGTTVAELARLMAGRMGAPEPTVTGKFRDGDVRAAFADISSAADELGWHPQRSFEDGLTSLLEWMDGDVVEAAR